MINTALEPLQRAIYTRLINDAQLTSMINDVFDYVSEGTALPYVTLGDDTVNKYDTKTDKGEDLTITLHCWSAGPGKVEAKQIMNAVLQAMTKEPLVVEGFNCEGVEREFLEVYQDETVYHGVCRFRIYIKQQ